MTMTAAEFLAEREQRDMSYAPDWLVNEVHRQYGYYRYRVVGENLSFPPGHPDRKFAWSVRRLDRRFFLASEVER